MLFDVEDEERDDSGRWTSGGGGSTLDKSATSKGEIARQLAKAQRTNAPERSALQAELDKARAEGPDAKTIAYLKDHDAAFRATGGTVEHATAEQCAQAALFLRDAAAVPGLTNAQLTGLSYMRGLLQAGAPSGPLSVDAHPEQNVLIARDASGAPVAAISYEERDNDLHVGLLGSTGIASGAGSALQVEMVRQAAQYFREITSSIGNDAEPFHLDIGRRISMGGLGAMKYSDWTAMDVNKIARAFA